MNPTKPLKEQSNFDALYHAVFNSLPGNVVIIDNKGAIVKVNRNWNTYAIDNGFDANIDWAGQNYLEVCRKLSGISKEDSDKACKLINRVLVGEEADLELDYQGHKADEPQWFKLQASGFEFNGATYATIVHSDITKHSNAERALKESELDFNLLANSSPGVIYRCCLDDPWEMHSISDKIESLSGYPKEDFLGLNPIRPFGEIMHPDDREEASRLVQIAIDKKEPYKLAYRVIHKDGHINYVFGYGQATYKSDGSPDYLVGVIFNDTDRVVALNKVKESAKRFRATFEQAAVGIAHVSPNGSFLRINQKFCDIVGYSQKEMLELSFQDITHPDDLALDIGNVNKLLQGELETYSMVKRYFHKNGSIIWVNLTVSLMQTSAGEPDYFVSVIEEVTARIEAEISLKDSENKFRALFDSGAYAMGLAKMADRKAVMANKVWLEHFGYNTDLDVAGKLITDFIAPEERSRILEIERLRLTGNAPGLFNTLGLRKDNTTFNMEMRVTTFHMKGEKYLLAIMNDITARIEAEISLKDSENKFRALFEKGGYAMSYAKSSDGIAVMANQAWLDLFGYKYKSEVEGQRATDFIVPEERGKILEMIRLRQLGKAPSSYYTKGMRKDGSTFDMEMRVAQFEMDGEKYALAMMNDVTERMVAEKKIQESEENYRTLIEQANDGIVVLQNDKVKFANSALTQITGYSVEELTGSNFIDFIYEKELANVKAKYAKRMNGEHVAAYESKIIHKNGSVIDVEFNGRLTQYKGQVADLAMVRDISERKKADKERNRLFKLSSDLIAIADFDGMFKQLNPAWENTFGYTQDELMAEPFINFIHPDDHQKTEAEMEKLATGRTTIDFENRYLHKNGSIIHVFWAATPVPEQGILYCIGRDITERKKVETQILQYQRRLKDQAIELTLTEEKQRKEIAVDLHDQVGQLLAYSRMQLAALTTNLSKEEILDKISDISQGLLSAIDTTRSVIFDLSPPQLQELGLFAAIGDWMDEEVGKHSNIQTSINGDDQRYHLNENVRILLFRCVRELLINTLKHAKANKVDVYMKAIQTELQITVSDNGIGFNYQPAKLKLKQTGFGLFSVLERITDLGGSVDIKTAPGNGTDIILKVPVTL